MTAVLHSVRAELWAAAGAELVATKTGVLKPLDYIKGYILIMSTLDIVLLGTCHVALTRGHTGGILP